MLTKFSQKQLFISIKQKYVRKKLTIGATISFKQKKISA